MAFFSTPEGRVIKIDSDYDYEYFLTDHLGNTRLVFGWLKDKDLYKATMETENNSAESSDFINLSTRHTDLHYNHTPANQIVGTANESARLNGFNGTAMGPGMVLSVSNGDKVTMDVFAKYQQGTGNNTTLVNNMFALMASSFGIVNTGETASLYQHLDNEWAASLGSIPINNSVVPKAYLNYILVDENNTQTPVFGWQQITSAALVDFEQLSLEIDVPFNGNLYIYVANESNAGQNVNVMFDDLMITHQKNTSSLQVSSSDDYYPFGLQISQNAYQRESAIDQNYKYNGKELQTDLDLNWHDYGARMYDAAIGRWHVLDPLSDAAHNLTPYRYAFNNPLRFIDPDGLYESVSEMIKDAWNKTGEGENRKFRFNNGEQSGNSDGETITDRQLAFELYNSNTQILPSLPGQDSFKGRFKNFFKSNRRISIGEEEFDINADGFLTMENFQINAVMPEAAGWLVPGGQARLLKFRNLKTAYIHFAKHVKGHVFNQKTYKWVFNLKKANLPKNWTFAQYLDEAAKFFSKTRENVITYSKNGYLFKYDVKTGYFGILNPTGEIATFFKPDRGIKYFVDAIKAVK